MLNIKNFKTMGEDIFATTRSRDVLSDLGENLYYPKYEIKIPKDTLLNSSPKDLENYYTKNKKSDQKTASTKPFYRIQDVLAAH